MKTKFFVLLFLAFFSRHSAYCLVGQAGFSNYRQPISVTGKIMDASDSSILAGATVSIRELGLETLSSDDGVFVFKTVPNIRITITVEYSEYLPAEIAISNSSVQRSRSAILRSL